MRETRRGGMKEDGRSTWTVARGQPGEVSSGPVRKWSR